MYVPKDMLVGSIFETTKGYLIEVIEYKDAQNVKVKFLNDGRGYSRYAESCAIRRGNVATPYHPGVCGIGYQGEGVYQSKNGRVTDAAYSIWSGVLERCYNEKHHTKFPSYIGCTTSEEWHNFQNFAEWYYSHKYRHKDWMLDKDILVKGNRLYSKETCCFVPNEVNCLFHTKSIGSDGLPVGVKRHHKCKDFYEVAIVLNGKKEYIGFYSDVNAAFEAYKEVKEQKLKSLAFKYEGLLEPIVFETLMNYEVSF